MKKSGIKKAAAAVARKLAIIMLRMWQEMKGFVFGEKSTSKKDKENWKFKLIALTNMEIVFLGWQKK